VRTIFVSCGGILDPKSVSIDTSQDTLSNIYVSLKTVLLCGRLSRAISEIGSFYFDFVLRALFIFFFITRRFLYFT